MDRAQIKDRYAYASRLYYGERAGRMLEIWPPSVVDRLSDATASRFAERMERLIGGMEQQREPKGRK